VIFDKIHSKIPLGKKMHLLFEDPMLQRNNPVSLYSASFDDVAVFYRTQKTHSLTVIFQNPAFHPWEYLKTI